MWLKAAAAKKNALEEGEREANKANAAICVVRVSPHSNLTPQFSWWTYGRVARYLINKFGIIEERVVRVWEMYRRMLPKDSIRVNWKGEEEFLIQVA